MPPGRLDVLRRDAEGVEEHDRTRLLTELLRERNTLIQLTEEAAAA
jgi:hypothetical protein